jgi:hypothetical protein
MNKQIISTIVGDNKIESFFALNHFTVPVPTSPPPGPVWKTVGIDFYETCNKPEKPKSSDQNCRKQKLWKSDIAPFSEVEKSPNLHGDILSPF